MHELLAMPVTYMADASSAASTMRDFVRPVVVTMCALASLVCVFFLVTGGIAYITSAGNPDSLAHAKKTIRNALIGLVLVIAAAVLTQILVGAYSDISNTANASLPQLTTVPPNKVSNGLVAVLIKAVTGFLDNIIQTIATPFLKALSFFTTSTPLMASNSSVFNLWRVMVAISDVLLILVIALIGFNVMGASTFGFDEIEFKHLLPRIGLMFLLANVSIFAIDGIIELSNAMIHAITVASGSHSVWDTLTTVVKQASDQSVAALLIMIVFLAISFILLIYYVGRLITLYIGAVLAPIVALLWLIPGFRDFSETAAKTYIMTVFVLFVHVVILQLAASLFAGMAIGSPTHTPDTLMAMITGVATLIALLKTQGVMMQLSFVSMGSRNARMLGSQFVGGVSYLAGRRSGKNDIDPDSGRRLVPGTGSRRSMVGQVGGSTVATGSSRNRQSGQNNTTTIKSSGTTRKKTGSTTVAPKISASEAKVAKPVKTMEKP